MHSSRMRTARSFPWTETPLDRDPLDRDLPGQRPPEKRPPGQRSPPNREPPGNMTCGACWNRDPPGTEFLTHACENISLPQLRFVR